MQFEHLPNLPDTDEKESASSTALSSTDFSQKIHAILSPYQSRYNDLIAAQSALHQFGIVEEIKNASTYALSIGGKRLRPAIVWMVCEALGQEPIEVCDNVALAVEYFHNASLIADDLPCMDNDNLRRGQPTTHKAFSEATALLTSFSLIALGFQSIAQAKLPQHASATLHQIAVLEASRTMGSYGIIGGQSIDLNPPEKTENTIEKIIDMKTGALFDLSFSLGWLFGGGSSDQLDAIHDLSRDFGRAFQILDDLNDLEQDKKINKQASFTLCFGVKKSIEAVEGYIESALLDMKALGFYQKKEGYTSFPLIDLCRALSTASQSFSDIV